MKTETTDREDYKRPDILVIKFKAMSSNLLVDSDEYYYEGAPDD